VECHAVNCFAVCEAAVIRHLPANPRTLRAGMNPVSVTGDNSSHLGHAFE